MSKECGLVLKESKVADARSVDRPDCSADAILLFGPLYHIIEPEERMLCLKECYRLLKPNGLLFTANITRYSTMIKYVAEYEHRPYLDDEDFYNMIANTVNTGVHTKKPMGLAYFHTPEELKHEIKNAGFKGVDVRGVIGPCCSECGDNAICINEDVLPVGTCINCGYVNDIYQCDKCASWFNIDEGRMSEDDIAICQMCLENYEE